MKLFYSFLALLSGCLWATAQVQSFEPTSDISGTRFGSYVEITAQDLVVSSSSSTDSPGKVYIFNTNLEQIQSIFPTEASIDDEFGSCLAVQHNFLAISASGDDTNGENTGAVYIYKKEGIQYDFTQKIVAPDGMPNDNFGSSIKIQSGFLFVVADGDDSETDNFTGSVYVYVFAGNQWVYSQKLTSTTPQNWWSGGGAQLIMSSKILIYSNNTNTDLNISSSTVSSSFRLINGLWVFQYSSQLGPVPGGGGPPTYDYQISEGQTFTIAEGEFGGYYFSVSNILPPPFYSESFGFSTPNWPNEIRFFRIYVNEGILFLGNASTPASTKKPVMYFKRTGTDWNYQSLFYGNGPENMDDYFGTTIATAGGKAVIGAPLEGNGKAYFASEATLKTDSFNKNTIEVYPNPVQDMLKITNDNGDLSSVEVYSVTGKLLLAVESNIKEIDMTNFETGMYLIKITTIAGTKQSFKITKN